MNNKKNFLIFFLAINYSLFAQLAQQPAQPALPVTTPEQQPVQVTSPAPISEPTPAQPVLPTPVPEVVPATASLPLPTPVITQEQSTPTVIQDEQIEIKEEELTQAIKAPTENINELKDIYLNFENAELSSFINYIADIKKLNLIPDKTLEGVKVSLTIREALSADQAWNVFLTVIEMAGFSIIKIGNVNVVMPKKDKTKQPLPAYINVPLDTLPNSDENIRYVTFLENIEVQSIIDLLRSMLSPEHNLIPYQEVNGLIITDKSYNIKSAMQVIRALDQTGLQESVVVLKLKRINASDVKQLFESLINKTDNQSPLARLMGKQAESNLKYFSPTTRMIPIEQSNSLVLLGTKQSIDKVVDFIVNHLDTELKETISPLHIYELQYTDAEQIKNILESLDVSNIPNIGDQAAKYGAIRDGVKYFKAMKYEVDKDGNRLIVSCTDKQDWNLLKKTIQDLDKPQPQVAIETLFVTVSITDNKELGGSIRNKKTGQIGKNINFQSPSQGGSVVITENDPKSLLGNMLNAVTGGLGTSIISFGQSTNIWAVFKALSSQTHASILAQPFITVANKTKGHLEYGDTQNVVMEQSSANSLIQPLGFQGYKEISAMTSLDITPQINIDGIIRLTLEINIDEFTNAALGAKEIKKVKTDVTVADGQVIALGGFVKTTTNETYTKTPILGDIPLLGWFFKYKKTTLTKNYIFMFMSPTIVKPRSTPGTNLYTRMKLHNAKKTIENTEYGSSLKDPIDSWFFDSRGAGYANKVTDFASAKYQPTTVDIRNDPYYRTHTERDDDIESFPEDNQNQQEKNITTEIIPDIKIKKTEMVAANKNDNLKNKSTSKLKTLKTRRGLTC